VEEGESSRFFERDEESQMVLASSEGGLYVALPAGHSVLQYHFEGALHGHTVKLMPGMGLLEPSGPTQAANMLATSLVDTTLNQEEIETFQREITPESVAADVERYSGKSPTDDADGTTIESRHIQHEHNALAVSTLVLDLERIGGDDFSVRLHRFTEVTTAGSYALDNVEAELPGSELQEMVLITAHLDSTAAFTDFEGREYDPDEDSAPGADDDGSGLAAVLAAAHAIKVLSAVKRPKRTIRFVLFNAEEEGLVGSGEYARDQRALRAPIAAVYQMDMIGYNVKAPRSYEIHAGADSQDVQDRSRVLAERIGRLSEQVSPNLPAPQIYLNKDSAQQNKDPAYNRSDHHSFHLVRYAACAVTEDFFAGPRPGAPQSEGNPNYHQTSDTFVDPQYAADIARAVAAAAWVTANL
jgi:leucyl aminopeptidase